MPKANFFAHKARNSNKINKSSTHLSYINKRDKEFTNENYSN